MWVVLKGHCEKAPFYPLHLPLGAFVLGLAQPPRLCAPCPSWESVDLGGGFMSAAHKKPDQPVLLRVKLLQMHFIP